VVKAQDNLLRLIQKNGKMFLRKHFYLTKRKFGHHKGLLRFIWSLYHKAIVVNTWKVKLNQLIDTNLFLMWLTHWKNSLCAFFFSVVKLRCNPSSFDPWVRLSIGPCLFSENLPKKFEQFKNVRWCLRSLML
jgi:hypothetical protein